MRNEHHKVISALALPVSALVVAWFGLAYRAFHPVIPAFGEVAGHLSKLAATRVVLLLVGVPLLTVWLYTLWAAISSGRRRRDGWLCRHHEPM